RSCSPSSRRPPRTSTRIETIPFPSVGHSSCAISTTPSATNSATLITSGATYHACARERGPSAPASTCAVRRFKLGRTPTSCPASTSTAPAVSTSTGIGAAANAISRATATASTTSTALSARNTSRPIPNPIRVVTPGARNFNGASRKEIASTMPNQLKTTATAAAAEVWCTAPHPFGSQPPRIHDPPGTGARTAPGESALSGQLATSGGDLLPPGVPDGARHSRRPDPPDELALHRLGAGVPLAAGSGVERDQVHVRELPQVLVQQLAQQISAPRLVVDVADQRVLDRNPAPGLVRVTPGRLQHLGHLPAVVHRHQGVPQLVVRGVQRHRERHLQPLRGHPPDGRDHAHRGNGHRPLREPEPVRLRIADPVHGVEHPLVVRQRLAHPHEHHVGQPPRPAGHVTVAHRGGRRAHLL